MVGDRILLVFKARHGQLNFKEATSAHVHKLNFPYGNSDWVTRQPVVIQKIFPILLCQSVSIPDILYC